MVVRVHSGALNGRCWNRQDRGSGVVRCAALSPKIYRLYPDVEPAAIEDALHLERQLAQNLRAAIAA